MIHWHVLVPTIFFTFLLGAIFADTLGRQLFVWFIKKCPDPLARMAMQEMFDQAAGRVYIVAYYYRLHDRSERGAEVLITTLQRAHEEGECDAAVQLAQKGIGEAK